MRTPQFIVGCLLLILCAAGCKRQVQQEAEQALRVSAADADAAEPAIAAGRDGISYVVWVEHHSAGADLMLGKLNHAGRQDGPPVRVNSHADEATAWRGDPPTVAVAPDGAVYVGWTARVSDDSRATNLYLSKSSDSGRSFAPPMKVNDDPTPADHGMHSLAIAADGTVYVAWLDERSNAATSSGDRKMDHKQMEANREVFIASSKDGGKTFSPNQRIANEVCPCCKTSLGIAPDGRIYAAWRQVLPGNFRHIAVASSSDGGRSFSSPVIVSDDQWMLAGCPVSGASLSVASDGTLRVLWYSAGAAGPAGIYWAESHDSGQSFTPRQLLAEGQAQGTPVLLSLGDGGAAAVWQEGDKAAPRLMTTQLAAKSNPASGLNLLGHGELPGAVRTGDQVLVVYVLERNQTRSIYLSAMPVATLMPVARASGDKTITTSSNKSDSAPRENASGSAATLATTSYHAVGVVKSLNWKWPSIEIDHEDIKGLMPAMSMEFYVKSKSLLNGIQPGDRIEFTIENGVGGLKITQIRKQ